MIRGAFWAGPMIVQELAVPSTPEFGRRAPPRSLNCRETPLALR
jgi:hypothetical protein